VSRGTCQVIPGSRLRYRTLKAVRSACVSSVLCLQDLCGLAFPLVIQQFVQEEAVSEGVDGDQ
jgi:hypothetical protein